MLIEQFKSGVLSTGIDVINIGILPTPVNYYSMYKLDVAGAVQITGSHNPPEFNGFKLSMNSGVSTVSIANAMDCASNDPTIMAEAGKKEKGTMAAIVGLDDSTVEKVCSSYDGKGTVVAANFNMRLRLD